MIIVPRSLSARFSRNLYSFSLNNADFSNQDRQKGIRLISQSAATSYQKTNHRCSTFNTRPLPSSLYSFRSHSAINNTQVLPLPRQVQSAAISMSAQKITEWVLPENKSGEFKRQTSSFRQHISREPGAKFPPEKGRYHLYVSYACPWAHRTLITRKLMGLEDFISFSVVHWELAAPSWRFVTQDDKVPGENVIPDPIEGHEAFTHLRDVYLESDKDYNLRFTVPVLYDKKTKQVVSNESAEIIRMLGTEFDDLIDEEHRSVALYPEGLRTQIDEINAWVYDLINNGVYKAGFATTAEAYEKHCLGVFEGLDRLEKHLSEKKGRFLFGDSITEADIRAWVTLIRFDPVYVQHFKCNIKDIRSGYPHIHRYMRDLYWNVPAFHSTTEFDHIKWHYTRSHKNINPTSITPLGPLPHVLPLDEEVPAARVAV